jgi:SET domain-containing protein
VNYYIHKSEIHGKGIFANKNFNENEKIGHLINVVSEKDPKLKYFKSSLSDSLGTFLERSELERYLNHSFHPNAKCKITGSTVELFAIKPIKKHEEITVDYKRAYEILDVAQIKFKIN